MFLWKSQQRGIGQLAKNKNKIGEPDNYCISVSMVFYDIPNHVLSGQLEILIILFHSNRNTGGHRSWLQQFWRVVENTLTNKIQLKKTSKNSIRYFPAENLSITPNLWPTNTEKLFSLMSLSLVIAIRTTKRKKGKTSWKQNMYLNTFSKLLKPHAMSLAVTKWIKLHQDELRQKEILSSSYIMPNRTEWGDEFAGESPLWKTRLTYNLKDCMFWWNGIVTGNSWKRSVNN